MNFPTLIKDVPLSGNLPALEDLRPGQQWVCFTKDKVPYTPSNGKKAEADEPTTWGTYEEAIEAIRARSQLYVGIGREFLKEQGITGIDLDHSVDEQGNISAFAQQVLKLLNSYAERSPNDGIHIWVYGSIPRNLGTAKPIPDGIEIYDHVRYFTITGNHLPGTPTTIEYRQEELTTLYQETVQRRRAAKQRKTKQHEKTRTRLGYGTPYGLQALKNESHDLALTQPGARNDQLNLSAFSLGQLIGGEELSRSTVERELSLVASRIGLEDNEIEKTIRSGIEAGMKLPRQTPLKERTKANIANGHTNHITGNGLHPRQEDNAIADATTSSPPIATDEELCTFDPDDSGNGDAMFVLFGQEFLWCSARGWFRHNGTHWQLDADGAEVKQSAVETLRRRRRAAVELEKEAIIRCTKADDRRVTGCLNRFKTLVSVSIDEFDRDPDLLNCQNGILDLRTGTLKPHDRKQRFTYCLPIAYAPSDYTVWLDFLSGVVGGGQEVIDYIQMAVGYSLTGHTREEILFYLFGPTRSGKGTFAETFMALLPTPLSTMVDFNSFTAKRDGDVSNFDLAPLKPSRLIFASENNRSQSLNPAKIKQLTGGDHIRACFKHRDYFEYRPQFKVWMMSNHPVNGDPEDDALWARVRVIEFPNSFLGKEDKTKKARLKEPEVLQGILYWAVQGAIKWYALGARGLATPAPIVKLTQAQRDQLDYVQQWLDVCCDDDDDGWVSNEDIMASYLDWCKANNIQYPKSQKILSQSLNTKGYRAGEVKKHNGKSARGVGGLYIYPVTVTEATEESD